MHGSSRAEERPPRWSGRGPGAAGRRALRRARRRRRDHRRRRRARRRHARAAHRARRTRRLRVGHVVEVVEARPRRDPLPAAAGDSALVYEALAERQILRDNAPHLVRVLPFLLPVFTRDGLLARRLARLLGTTMWMYDLTGGLRIGKLHKRVGKEEALRYMPTLPRRNVAGVVHLLRRPDRRRAAHAHRRAHRGRRTAPRSSTTRARRAATRTPTGASRGARVRGRRRRGRGPRPVAS